jgi:PAS domain S-box-containing protein
VTWTPDRLGGVRAPGRRTGPATSAGTLLALAATGVAALVVQVRQRRSTALIRQSERLRRAVLDTAGDAYIAMDPDGTVTDWNPAAERLLGWPAEQALGSLLSALIIPPGHRAGHDHGLRRFLLTEEPALPDGTLRLSTRHRDGSDVPVEMTLSRMRWGDSWRFHAFLRDDTERLRRQAELTASETMFRNAFDDAMVGMALTDERGIFVRVNAVFAAMLGRTAEELIGRAFTEVSDPADRGLAAEMMSQVLSGELPEARFTKRYVHLDGSLVYAELCTSLMRDADGQPLYFATQTVDVTARHLAQHERDTHLVMLRSVIANNPCLIYVKDLEGHYLLANEPFQQVFGVTEDDVLGKDDTYLDPVLAPVWRANDLRAQQGEYRGEEWADGVDGRRYYESVKAPLLDGGGQVYATCGISWDVTQTRLAAAALVDARDAALAATAAKSAFLATMSHELRTPMNAVIGLTEVLLDSCADPEQRELLDTVRRSGDTLLAIINDVLDYSKIESGELRLDEHTFALRDCVESALDLVALPAHRKGLELVADIGPACPELLVGDGTRCRQVIVNLVSNAVKFTAAGEVVVTVTTTTAGSDRVRLRVDVRDTGIGIPPGGLDRLFRSFSQVDTSTTRQYGGTGLGLAISRRLAEAMGGGLEVVSEVGAGSTFTMTALLGLLDERRRDDGPDLPLVGRTALVVDDNGASRRVLCAQLAGWGMVCTDLAEPGAALALVAGGAAFDVALLDLHMPGTDGDELAQQLRTHPAGRALPLVLLSDAAARLDAAQAPEYAAVLSKPLGRAALRDAVVGTCLPAAEIVPAPETAGGRRRGDGPARLRVLLAEDNPVNQLVAQLMLGQLGHQVDTVANGLQAVEAVHREVYDVVLMDVQMPVLDGLAATGRIRAELPPGRQPYILALTASALAEDRTACLAAGVDAFLSKPVRQTDLGESLLAVPVRSADALT